MDHRSDIFSLGIILYELLSGKRAFEGESSADMMTAILREDPPELPDSVPLGLRQIVHRCLEKKPQERFQSARDLAFALRSLSGSTGVAKIVAEPASRHRWLLAAAIAIPVALAIFLAALWFTRPQALDLSSYRYTPFATDAEPEIESFLVAGRKEHRLFETRWPTVPSNVAGPRCARAGPIDENGGRHLQRCWESADMVAGREPCLFRQRSFRQTVVGERGGRRAPGGFSQYIRS